MFVREADVAYDLGPRPPVSDHAVPSEPHADPRRCRGSGGVRRRGRRLADLCARIGVAFIGPER